tara:strand:+ start:174 stop:1001 length:828 start_codon:yes stop_codon:yes gene_type:complete
MSNEAQYNQAMREAEGEAEGQAMQEAAEANHLQLLQDEQQELEHINNQKQNKMDFSKLKEEMPFKWKVQTANAYAAKCVAFIDARDVQEKLDSVCKPENWQVKYGIVNGNLFCSIGIYNESTKEWIWKSDCGTESNVEKEKGEASDAFKRAGVMWGIGRFLYSKPIVELKTKENGVDRQKNKKYTPINNNGNYIYDKEEITALCNAGGNKNNKPAATPQPAATKPAKTQALPNLTKALFDKIVVGSKEQIEAALKAYTMSEKSELELNKAIKAYE